MNHPSSYRAVVLGGGFAGLSAARVLAGRVATTLVARSAWFEFLPNIHELISGVKTPRALRIELAPILARAGARFVEAEVIALDLMSRELRTRSGERIGYDVLVLALGGENNTRGVRGALTNARSFKSVADCAAIGARLEDLAARPGRHDIVIVGGGLEGVEALGEILRRFRAITPADEGAGPEGAPRFRVHIVDGSKRLLPEAPAAVHEAIVRLAAPFDVHFDLDAHVVDVEEAAVHLKDGRVLPSALTIWTGGARPPVLLASSGLAPEGRWAPVEPSLRSVRDRAVFIAGDAAALPRPIAKQAYHAMDMGRWAAKNVLRSLDRRSLLPFRPSEKPTLLAFGDLSTFLITDGLVAEGPALAAGKEAVMQLALARFELGDLRSLVRGVGARMGLAARALLAPQGRSLAELRRLGHLRLHRSP